MTPQNEDEEEDLFELYHQSGNERDRPQVDHTDHPPGHNSGDDNLDDLDLNDLMLEARKDLLVDLLRAVRGGYASPQEKSTLRQMLKDNGVIMGNPFDDDLDEGTNGKSRKAPLPTFGKPDYTP